MTATPMNIATKLLSAQNHADLAQAVQILKSGGIVALPTETVYGLAANGFCSTAIQQIYQAKKRPSNNPLIYHVAGIDEAKSLLDQTMLSGQSGQRFTRLAQKFWPGPLTIVAKKSNQIDGFACAHLPHVAIRVPNSPITLAVLKELDFPLVMPSANISTRPSPTKASHVLKTLNHRIHAIVDGGECTVGIESSVVSIHGETVKILRPGSISKNELEQCLDEEVDDFHDGQEQRPSCPGQAYLHYSPQVKSILLLCIDSAEQAWTSTAQIMGRTGDFVTLAKRYGHRPAQSYSLALSNDPTNFAKELYDALYTAEEKADLDLVIIEPPRNNPEWEAIHNRLMRSCSSIQA